MTTSDLTRAQELFEELRALLAKHRLVAMFQLLPMEADAISWAEADRADEAQVKLLREECARRAADAREPS